MIDEKLLKACADDDRKAQFELYRVSYSLLMSIAYRYVNNKEDAEAKVNEGFFKVLKGMKTFTKANHPMSAFNHWISRIMINTMIDDYRSAKKKKKIMIEDVPVNMNGASNDYNEIDEGIEAEHLQAMLEKLSLIQRNVFNLFAIDGYSHEEIALLLEIPIGTSKWHLGNARKVLMECLQQFKPVQLKQQKHEAK